MSLGPCWSRIGRAATLERFAPVKPMRVCWTPGEGRAAVKLGRVCLRVRRDRPHMVREAFRMGSVVKKRRKRMAKKKHRKLLRKTRVQRRRLGK